MSFVPHYMPIVADPSRIPERWMLFLHGAYGSGDNWVGFARRIVRSRPAWGAAVVDLRLHGESRPAPGPHTLEACAEDLVRLAERLGDVRAVSGHSFGGKVALLYSQRTRKPLDRLWILDSDPSAHPARLTEVAESDASMRALSVIERMPTIYSERAAFIGHLQEMGFAASVANWFAKNLRRDGNVFRLTLDMPAIRELLTDYVKTDSWALLNRPAAPDCRHFVLGGKSGYVSAESRVRLEQLHDRGRLTLHRVQEAGHWLQVDAPERLESIFLRTLS